ncbi:MAG: DUF3667 domain-containing protein [Bacteroidales bacterium]|nr:DUF3667 domain-containing protein [Candidatus Sodaliphilus limicaballi]
MKIEEIKKLALDKYRQFKTWQQEPVQFHVDDMNESTCLCCGTEYRGHYCPACGQTGKIKRISWKSVMTGAADVWGLGSRSMPRNVWHLIFRPGYLIADYLGGRRQVYFPPFKMLFLMVTLVALLKHYAGFEENFDDAAAAARGVNLTVIEIIKFVMEHRILATLSVIMLMALIVRLFFGADRRTQNTNLCECIYTQVWIMNQMLIISVLFNLLKIVTGAYIENLECVVLLGMMCATYKQLFGLGWWSTLWRTVVMLLLTLVVYVVVILLFVLIIEFSRHI